MKKRHYVPVFLAAFLVACAGAWLGSLFHFWALRSLGVDLGKPHPALALLGIGLLGIVMNEVRHTYFEMPPYDYLIQARRTAVMIVDAFVLAGVYGTIIRPVGNPLNSDSGVSLTSIMLIGAFIALMLLGKDLAVDIGINLAKRR